jgi:hypothetical protein
MEEETTSLSFILTMSVSTDDLSEGDYTCLLKTLRFHGVAERATKNLSLCYSSSDSEITSPSRRNVKFGVLNNIQLMTTFK